MTGRDDGGGGVHGLWMVLASVAVAVSAVMGTDAPPLRIVSLRRPSKR